jgi:hypothetical protein
MKHFAEALNKQEEVATALEFGNYERAIALQKNCEVLYIAIDNQELAARYWEQLAEKLFDLDAFKDAKKALEYSLVLFKTIEDLADKDEILKRLREEIEICISPQKVLLSIKTTLSQNPPEINKNLVPQTPKKKSLWDDLA